MPIIRNPFRRNADAERTNSAEVAPNRTEGHTPPKSPIAISVSKDNGEANEYKLSEVSDNGVYLPPSPPEKRSFWRSRQSSATSSRNRLPASPADPEQQFTISRESFDSYRRSFDVSARSPVFDTSSGRASMDVHTRSGRASMDVHPRGRMSLDARPVPPRMSLDSRSPQMLPPAKPVEESEFEDVCLNDDSKPKKRGILSRFGGDSNAAPEHDGARPNSRGHIFGRKDRPALKQQDSELKQIDPSRRQSE